jgi:GT2 family glycosyltransferase
MRQIIKPNHPMELSTAREALDLDACKAITTVIIPHYDDLENLRRCLEFLKVQTLEQSRYEIVVADNNSSCGLTAVETVCQGIARVAPAPKTGAAEARNVGVAAARGEVLAFLDSDCRPAPDWLERGIEALDGTDIVGGRVIVSVDDRMRLTAAEAYETVFAFNNRRYIKDHGFSVTANMFTRRNVFTTVGAFRTEVSEDVDWGHRAAALGFRMRYVADAVVSHPARREWSDLIRKWRRMTRQAYALAREQPYGRLRWFGRSWLILLSPLVHFIFVLQCREIVTFDQRLKAIGALFRLRAWRFFECNRVLFKHS